MRKFVVWTSVVSFFCATLAAAPATWNVGAAGNSASVNGDALRNVLATAGPGDTILLAHGATFEGPFQLNSTASTYITIRTDTPDCAGTVSDTCLGPRARVSPADIPKMATLVTPANGNAGYPATISTATAASYYRFIGIELKTDYYVYNLVTLGTGSETSWQQLPHHITFDRCYLHGSYANGTRRGIAANAGRGTTANSGNPANSGASPQDDIVITNSYFAEFKDPNADSQAVAVWNGYGPFRFENNYFEGAGENVMFGGADPAVRTLVPSDITIRGNHFYKPLDWFNGTQANRWWVKNLFELKNAQNVVIDTNVFQHNWVNQQNGMGILFTPRNQDGKCPWCTIQNISFTNNVLWQSAGGMNILGIDDIRHTQQMNHVTIRNNLFLDINTSGTWGVSSADGRLFSVEKRTDYLTIDHNTAFQAKAITYSWDRPSTNFVFTANVVPHHVCNADNHACGMSGDSASPGISALDKYFVNPVVQYNEMYGNTQNWPYPSPNDFAISASFDQNFVLTAPTYRDAGNVLAGIDSSVKPNAAAVIQYCTSTPGIVCATIP